MNAELSRESFRSRGQSRTGASLSAAGSVVLLFSCFTFQPLLAQDSGDRGDSSALTLEEVRAAATQTDPRYVQPELIDRAARLRIQSLRRGALPQLAVLGEGSLQSDVPELDASLPGIDRLFQIPKEQVRAEAVAEWSVYDGGVRSRQIEVESARRDEHLAGVTSALYAVEEAASEAFFGILLLDARAESITLALEDLEARLDQVRALVRNGAATPAQAALLEAEAIRIAQQHREVDARRSAARITLSDLTGLPIPPDRALALPELNDRVAIVRSGEQAFTRPEIDQTLLQAGRLRQEARVLAARTRPTLALFGRSGIGRPSPLDFLSDEVQSYAVAGVRLRWNVVDWGRARRESEAIALQSDVLTRNAEALEGRYRRETAELLADLDRLDTALLEDARAIALREEVLRATRLQLDEGVILPDVYIDRLTDLAEARLEYERRRIERARTQTAVLHTVGRLENER